MPTSNLRDKASKNFERHLNDFLKTGQTTGLPAARLSDTEWALLNNELAPLGIKMVKQQHRSGGWYYWFTRTTPTPQKIVSLRDRASRNFDKYLNTFLASGESAGLPADRLSDSEWLQLNGEMVAFGVKLEKRHHENGGWYYWFTHIEQPTPSKVAQYNDARNDVINMLFDTIKAKYPNISNVAILEMINSGGGDVQLLYQKIRFKQDGHYADVSEKEYNNACEYALARCSNSIKLFKSQQYPKPQSWETLGRDIKMDGRQDWTWFRSCRGNTLPPINGNKNFVAFHISCNVNIYEATLKALDDIVVQDGGQYIYAYKFPKADYYYSEILTRHDPITIYMYARNPKLEQQIVRAMQPFVRSNEGLIDEMLGNGCCISPETSNNGGVSVGKKAALELSKLISQHRDILSQ